MKKMTPVLVFLTFLTLQGCSFIPKEKIEYIKVPCPKLKVWDVNKTVPSYDMHFKTSEEKEKWMDENEGFLGFVTEMGQYAWEQWGYRELYEAQAKEFNQEFADANR